MKLLILGAGNAQFNAIARAKEQGHTVIVSDYYPDPPGKAIADFHEQVSTFDVEGNVGIAQKYGVDGIMTLGTDQPVYTAAEVAQKLKLPAFLDVATAKAVTHKEIMKEKFQEAGIPTAKYRLLPKNFSDRELAGISFPVVVKPLDSQGQRGVYKLQSIAEIREVFKDVLSYSRESRILVEEYYPSEEITVSGWVVNGETFLISVVDRVSLENQRHIGICIAHHLPSKFLDWHYQEILKLSKQIVDSFKIANGPIYFQMLIGAAGIKVNEIACRIGGAYEDIYLHRATGIDILGMLIDASLGRELAVFDLKNHDLLHNPKRLSVELFFANPCKVGALADIDKINQLPGVVRARYHYRVGDQIHPIANATQRAGYLIIEGSNQADLKEKIEGAYRELSIYDEFGKNQVIRFSSNGY